jgi:hypothetical protein
MIVGHILVGHGPHHVSKHAPLVNIHTSHAVPLFAAQILACVVAEPEEAAAAAPEAQVEADEEEEAQARVTLTTSSRYPTMTASTRPLH